MRTASAKAKGRRASQQVKDLLIQYAPDLHPDDIVVTGAGATGPDLQLSPKAQEEYPFVIEVKNQEKLNVWSAIEQSQGHCEGVTDKVPILFFKRNNSDIHACLLATDLLSLLKPEIIGDEDGERETES